MKIKYFTMANIMLLFLCACNESLPNNTDKKNNEIKSAKNEFQNNLQFGDSIIHGLIYLKYATDINAPDEYHLKVYTIFLEDSLKSKESFLFDQNDVVCRQTLYFYHGDSILRIMNNPSDSLTRSYKNYQVKILDNVILWAGFTKGKNDFFYNLYGAGGCNGCSEAFYFYSRTGTLLWHYYSKKGGAITDNKLYNKIISDYKVPDTILNSKFNKMIYVYPPFEAGEKLETTIR